MESLLLIKGIKVVSAFHDSGAHFKFAYTEKMLTNNLFIEFYERQYEPGEDEPLDGIVRYETAIWVVTYYKKVAYQFMMLNEIKPQIYTTKQAVPILQIYQIILGLVEIIDSHIPRKLMSCLKQISIDSFTSREYSSNPTIQKKFTDMVLQKISTVRKIIEQTRISGN